MPFKRVSTGWFWALALWSPFVATGARADFEPFLVAERVSDSTPSSLQAVYHGVPVYWPSSSFKIPLEVAPAQSGDKLWLWIEGLGRGKLSVEGLESPDRTWMERPELSNFVETWAWRRYPLDEGSIEGGELRIETSVWGDLFLGNAFLTREAEAQPVPSDSLQLSEKTQLLQGRALYPYPDLAWGGAYIRILDADGATIGTSLVNRQGNFSTLVPRETELFAILFDRGGEPLTEKSPLTFVGEGVVFHPLVGRENVLWVGDRSTGLSIRTKNLRKDPTATERLCLLRLLDSRGAMSRFQQRVERESMERNPILLDLILEDRDTTHRSVDTLLADFCGRLSTRLSEGPLRRILIADGERVSKAMTLASERRDSFDGVIVWGGDPGEAAPTNFGDCPMALLGGRDDLTGMSDWIETCKAIQNPLLVKSYWSEPDPYTLETDVAEALAWVNLPPLGKLDRKLDHSTYLGAAGRHRWIWISQVSHPGALARVEAEWKTTGVIDLAALNVDRLRVHLNCGLEKPGQQVTLSLETLTLPIILGPRFEAIELRRRSDSLWSPRFLEFDAPIDSKPVANLPAAGFESGEELKAFARFVRDRFETDCSWGYRWKDPVSGGPFSLIDLCARVEPVPYVSIQWSFQEIDRFHQWRKEKGNLSLELAGYRSGVSASDDESSKGTLICAVVRSELEEFLQHHPESIIEFEDLRKTRRELVGTFLRKQFVP